MGKRLGLNGWWAVVRVDDGFVFTGTMKVSRASAIAAYDDIWSTDRYRYAASRRRGEVRAMRVTVEVDRG